MTNIKIRLWGQLKTAAASETVSIMIEERTLESIIITLAENQSSDLRYLLLNDDNIPRHSILGVINDEQIEWNKEIELDDGAEILLISPMAGG